MRADWLLDVVVSLHDALIEDLFDIAEARVLGVRRRPRRLGLGFGALQLAYCTVDRPRGARLSRRLDESGVGSS
ncbi:hypothetical protein [Parenemella sanctibonifatiensis]|uniref:Uncharacterized protein n=1 Tax=Parenemella sanctibonifatiensis TaxID=2016505 RepID=A0A255EL81_9ACTN|nr:hypothetical protein [Parenemella sanctibonifatiensis]OYN92276.1 hypothetical protein CGZ91_01845 [Parenemella sanctibonifatiensis]